MDNISFRVSPLRPLSVMINVQVQTCALFFAEIAESPLNRYAKNETCLDLVGDVANHIPRSCHPTAPFISL